MNCLGIPVRYDASEDGVASCSGIWPGYWINVGPGWLGLPQRQKDAVLMHEAAHVRLWHIEIRMLLLPLSWMSFVQRIMDRQEEAADRFVVEQGLGVELLEVLSKHLDDDRRLYPAGRLTHIERVINEHHHLVSA